MNKENLRVRAEVSVITLRQLATLKSDSEYEPLKVFKELEKDIRCNRILYEVDCVTRDESIVQYYNEHIRNSKLSKEEKKKLII